MKILMVCQSWDAVTGPYETLYPQIRDVVLAAGHELRVVDNHRNYLPIGGPTIYGYNFVLRRLRWGFWNDILVNRLLRREAAAFQPDAIIVSKGENLYWRTIAWLKQHTRAVLFNWNMDNPFWYQNSSMHLLRSIPLYDVYAAIGKYLVPVLQALGCPRVEFVPAFFDPGRIHFSGELTAEERRLYGSSVAFAGQLRTERADMLRQLLEFDVGIWGNPVGLSADDPIRERIRAERLDGEQYAKVLACTKIGVNVQNRNGRMANNLRAFEVTGMGALLITEYTPDYAALFVEDEEIVMYRSWGELRDKVEHYLRHDEERGRIARAGQARTLRDYTLEKCVKRILGIVADGPPEGAPMNGFAAE